MQERQKYPTCQVISGIYFTILRNNRIFKTFVLIPKTGLLSYRKKILRYFFSTKNFKSVLKKCYRTVFH